MIVLAGFGLLLTICFIGLVAFSGPLGAMEMFLIALLVLGLLWVVTLVGILGLASSGRYSLAGGGYALPVLAHVIWGLAALAVATGLAPVPLLMRLTLALVPLGIHLAWMLSPASA